MISNCCSANIIYTDICSECGEHCDAVLEEGEVQEKVKGKFVRIPSTSDNVPTYKFVRDEK